MDRQLFLEQVTNPEFTPDERLLDRLLRWVAVGSEFDVPDIPGWTLGPCWIWTGAKNKKGYGVITITKTPRLVHHFLFLMMKGALNGLEADHLCKNRPCCNPSHLEAVTHKENLMRSDGPCARNARKTHCLKGHPLTEGNLKLSCLPIRRICLTCIRERGRNRRRCARDSQTFKSTEPSQVSRVSAPVTAQPLPVSQITQLALF